MKVSISSTYHNNYDFFLPIITHTWNLLCGDIICFMPEPYEELHDKKIELFNKYAKSQLLRFDIKHFVCNKNQEATYAQCSRLFASAIDMPDKEVIVTSDIDMMVLESRYLKMNAGDGFTVYGSDLVPDGQYPICYIYANRKVWQETFNKNNLSYQQCLDNLLGDIDVENMRGNYWSKDQEEAYKNISLTNPKLVNRSSNGNQFATNRLDRDDSYILSKLTPDIFDFHMNRPGYEDYQFSIIMQVLKYYFPYDEIKWVEDYRNEYINIIK